MAKNNCERASCKDVFNAELLQNATYYGRRELPGLKPCCSPPTNLKVFSQAIGKSDRNCWIHFYEDDYKFLRVWNNHGKYLPILETFQGVITPDFSVHRDMPLLQQEWNIFRSRTIGHALQERGCAVIQYNLTA